MKKRTKAQLKKALWKEFAIFIKNRDEWRCVTCGREGSGHGMNAGHYIPKAACGMEYYFSEQNVHAQCPGCNLFLSGNHPEYRKYIIRKYGEEVLEDIEKNFRIPCPDFPLEEKIEYYKNLNKKI